MEQYINQLIESFDLKLILSITILSYITIKVIEKIKTKTKKSTKKIITAIVSLILCIGYYFLLNVELNEIIPSYLISIAFYDNIIKYVLNIMKINYNKNTN